MKAKSLDLVFEGALVALGLLVIHMMDGAVHLSNCGRLRIGESSHLDGVGGYSGPPGLLGEAFPSTQSADKSDVRLSRAILAVADLTPLFVSLEGKKDDPATVLAQAAEGAEFVQGDSASVISDAMQRYRDRPVDNRTAPLEQAISAFCQLSFSESVGANGRPTSMKIASSTDKHSVIATTPHDDAEVEALHLQGHCHLLAGQFSEAAECYRRCLPILNSSTTTSPRETRLRYALGVALWKQGQQDAAVAEWREAGLERLAQAAGETHLPVNSNLSIALMTNGAFDLAKTLLHPVLEAGTPFSPITLRLRQHLAHMALYEGDPKTAEKISEQSWEFAKSHLGAETLETLACEADVARCECERGALAEAAKHAGHAHDCIQKFVVDGKIVSTDNALIFQIIVASGTVDAASRNLGKALKELQVGAEGLRETLGRCACETLDAENRSLDLQIALDRGYSTLGPRRALLERAIKTLGIDQILTMRTSLGLARATMLSRALKDADGMLQALTVRTRQILPDGDPFAFEVEQNVAELASLQEDKELAKDMARTAYAGLKRKYGEASPKCLECSFRLGSLLADVHVDESLQFWKELTERLDCAFGNKHPVALYAKFERSVVLALAGKSTDAGRLLNEVTEAAGGQNTKMDLFDVATVLIWFASQLEKNGKLSDAQRMFESLLELDADEKSPHRAVAASHLAGILAKRGQLDLAETKLQEVLTLDDRIFGVSHSETGTTVNAVVASLRIRKDDAGALRFLHAREEVLDSIPGAGVVRINLILNEAQILKDQGNNDQCFTEKERALRYIEMEEGEDSRAAQGFANNLGIEFVNARRLDEAEVVWRKALESRERAFGPSDFESMSSLHNLAVLYAERQDFKKAIELEHAALDRREANLGREHSDTLASAYQLANDLYHGGNKEEALAYARQVYDLLSKSKKPNEKLLAITRKLLLELGEEPAVGRSAKHEKF